MRFTANALLEKLSKTKTTNKHLHESNDVICNDNDINHVPISIDSINDIDLTYESDYDSQDFMSESESDSDSE